MAGKPPIFGFLFFPSFLLEQEMMNTVRCLYLGVLRIEALVIRVVELEDEGTESLTTG